LCDYDGVRKGGKEPAAIGIFGQAPIEFKLTDPTKRPVVGRLMDSAALANKLQQEIDSGRTERFAVIHAAEQELTPNEPCRLSKGTGILRPPAAGERGAGDMLTGIKCNACDGNGFVPAFSTYYPFPTDNVRNFVAFLRGCGGFSIW